MVSLKIGNTHLNGINLVIFDKDGTLIDLNQYWVKITRLRAEEIAKMFALNEESILTLVSVMGVDIKAGQIKACGPVGKKKREVVMKSAEDYLASLGYDNPHNSCVTAFEDVDIKSISMFDELIHPLPGTERVIKDLHKNGCKIAIATSDRTERAKLAMEHLNLIHFIDLIVGADRITAPKPDPETITYILNKLEGNPKNTVVIGDTEVDMELGIRSGVKACIGVHSGSVPKESLMQKTPYVIKNVGLIEVDK